MHVYFENDTFVFVPVAVTDKIFLLMKSSEHGSSLKKIQDI
jgi:hypothetical protein